MPTLPLDGVRILSLAEQLPGPYATMLLADLGADVILVERPGIGDPSRRFPGLFAAFNRGKRSVTINLKSPEGLAEFLQLVDSADVVMEGFRPGVVDRLKIGADDLRRRKPSLVYLSISSFGQSGPNKGVAGHDLSIQGAAGMIDVPVGQEASYPLPVLPLADISSGMFAALGVVTALFARSRTDQGSTVDVSMLDALVSWMTPFLMPPMNGLPIRPLPPPEPCYGVFATADDRQITLSIAGEDAMWTSLCGVLGLERYSNLDEQGRIARSAEISPLLRAAIRSWPYQALYERLEADGIAFGPVLRANEVFADAQMASRGMTATLDGPEGRRTYIRQPNLYDGVGGTIARGVPALGQHNAELLGVPGS